MKQLWMVCAMALWMGCAQGPAGPRGESGPEGPQGPQGAKGEQGLQGIQGLTGGGFYTQRSDVYCVRKTGGCKVGDNTPGDRVLNSIGCSLTVYCEDNNDLPLTGTCGYPTRPSQFIQTDSSAYNWDTGSTAAGWSCFWGWLDGHTAVDMQEVNAQVCCVRRP